MQYQIRCLYIADCTVRTGKPFQRNPQKFLCLKIRFGFKKYFFLISLNLKDFFENDSCLYVEQVPRGHDMN